MTERYRERPSDRAETGRLERMKQAQEERERDEPVPQGTVNVAVLLEDRERLRSMIRQVIQTLQRWEEVDAPITAPKDLFGSYARYIRAGLEESDAAAATASALTPYQPKPDPDLRDRSPGGR